ncbi:MAG TPA: hypothetical protein VKF42_08865 [Chitinivibrionales bacterium]|jgi:hypothetical protein|nr:hypothetical protein [Chitinivibrionales bacterium]
MRRLAAFLIVASIAWPGYCQISFGTPITPRRDTLAADSSRRAVDTLGRGAAGKIKIVKRKVDYGKFVALAIGTMVFIALLFTTAQTWNPTGRNQ